MASQGRREDAASSSSRAPPERPSSGLAIKIPSAASAVDTTVANKCQIAFPPALHSCGAAAARQASSVAAVELAWGEHVPAEGPESLTTDSPQRPEPEARA